MLIHCFSLVNAWLLMAFGTAFYAITTDKYGKPSKKKTVICKELILMLKLSLVPAFLIRREGQMNVNESVILMANTGILFFRKAKHCP